MAIEEGSNTFDCIQHYEFSIPNCLLFDNEQEVNRYLQDWWLRIKEKITVHGLHQYNEGNGSKDSKWENFFYVSKEENYFTEYFDNIVESTGIHHETKIIHMNDKDLKDITLYEYTDIYCSQNGIPFVITPYSLRVGSILENKYQFLIIRISSTKPLRIINSSAYNLEQSLGLINLSSSKGTLRNNQEK